MHMPGKISFEFFINFNVVVFVWYLVFLILLSNETKSVLFVESAVVQNRLLSAEQSFVMQCTHGRISMPADNIRVVRSDNISLGE